MTLYHADLVNLGKALGYSGIKGGICRGFSCMLAQAFLAGEGEVFFARLLLIEKYNNFSLIPKLIYEVRDKVKNEEILNDEEIQLLEIPAFYESLILYQNPLKHVGFFNLRVEQSDLKKIFLLAKSTKMEKMDITLSSLIDTSYFFTKEILNFFLLELIELLKNSTPAPILLNSKISNIIVGGSHSVFLLYSSRHQQWLYGDINNMEECFFLKTCSTDVLITELFNSFENDNESILFSIQILLKNNNLKLRILFDGLDFKYATFSEKNLNADSTNALLLQACAHNHVEVVNRLAAPHNVNYISPTGETSLYAACEKNYLAVVVELLKNNVDINQPYHGFISW